MSSLNEYVADLYDEYINDQRGRGVWNLEDAWSVIEGRLDLAIAQGKVSIDLHQVGWKALQAADRSATDHGRRVLQKERRRANWLSLDDGAWLDVLIPLGKNDRCQLGDFGYDEYERSMALRNENLEAVRIERDEHARFMAPFVPHLRAGMSMRQIRDAQIQITW